MCLKYCYIHGKQCRSRSDAAFCSIWSGSTLFGKAYLSQYLGLLRYSSSSLIRAQWWLWPGYASMQSKQRVGHLSDDALVLGYLDKESSQTRDTKADQSLSWAHIATRYIFSCCGLFVLGSPLWKHAYSNILKILQPKKENFQIKNSANFHISAQNIDCGYLLERPQRGRSNECPIYVF